MPHINKIIKIAVGLLAGSLFFIPQISQAACSLPANGGTGTCVVPTIGQVLIGNAGGTYTPSSTSSLGISGGGTGTSTNYFSFLGSNIFPSTSTSYITADHFVATSTTATSTFAGSINLTGGCFAINNVCLATTTSSIVAQGSLYGQTLPNTMSAQVTLASYTATATSTIRAGGYVNITTSGGLGLNLDVVYYNENGVLSTSTLAYGTAGGFNTVMISGSYSLYNQDLWVSPGLVKLVVIVKTTGGSSSTFNTAGAIEQLNGASGIGTSQWLSNGNSIYYSLGNVGIGTTSPTNTLEVAGNTFLGGNLTATGTLSVTGNTTLAAATTTSLAITGITSQWLSTNANGSVIGNATPVTSLGGLTGSIATSSLGLQNKIALTTSGSSGASTFDGTTLNVPQYSSTVIPNTDNFRISAQSNVAVPTSDQIGAGSVYLVPYQGNMISLYTSSTWTSYATSTQGQFVLTGLTSGKNYDVFAYGSGTSVLLELSAAWASDSARTDALATQDGILVKSSDHSRRYLGTIRTTGTNTTEDSGGGVSSSVGGKRFVFNEYNQVPRFANVIDTTSSWSYTTGTVRQANGAVGNKVELVLGDASSTIILSTVYGDAYLLLNLARAGMVGVGLDTTTSFSGNVQGGYNTAASGIYAPVTGAFRGYVGLGYHYLSWNEDGADGTCTFLGSNAGDGQQTGLQASFSN